ncbi:hypothetical protein FQN54_006179 [Arachnomyces sp. PD_36]|nr:hypothetical protein FQN54_006179 [Arachnomyces sp. PD_36]
MVGRDSNEEERTLFFYNNAIPSSDQTTLGFVMEPRIDPAALPSQTTPLLAGKTQGECDLPPEPVCTTWKLEVRILSRRSLMLMITSLLQYSLTVASIFSIGHLGTLELGAVSLASMTANITGYAVYHGMATSIDTLCGQAYGSGDKKLVGLHMQRMVYFLLVITIPIAVIWVFADRILLQLLSEKDVAILAGRYLKVLIIGTPGYLSFESGKRFVQAQGIFSAPLVVMVICAPLNAFMNWLFVWKFEWGFVGAPVAVVITNYCLPSVLLAYTSLIVGLECWNGFTYKAFTNWSVMIKLAIPGFLMVESEVLAFEILTFAASHFGKTALAAQAVLSTCVSIAFLIPFPISVAASTRIANLIGSGSKDAARIAAKVSISGAAGAGFVNATFLYSLREYIPILFTSDKEVAELVARLLPICASFQIFDALAASCNGVLRGLGRQTIGGYVQLFCYYGVAMPLSMGTAFGLGWNLWGLWAGVAMGLLLVCCIEGTFLLRSNWDYAVRAAKERATEG